MHGCISCLVLKDISLVWHYFCELRNKSQSFTEMRPSQKQCQSPSIQCAGIRYPRSSEHPLIQSSLFTGGQVASLNGLFHGQTGHLPNMANTKASERQILNWSTSALQRKYHPLFLNLYFIFNPLCTLIYSFFVLFEIPCVSARQLFFFTFVFLRSVNLLVCMPTTTIQICNSCKYVSLNIIWPKSEWAVNCDKEVYSNLYLSKRVLSFSFSTVTILRCRKSHTASMHTQVCLLTFSLSLRVHELHVSVNRGSAWEHSSTVLAVTAGTAAGRQQACNCY